MSQFGTLEELLNLCSEVEGLLRIDFAHLHSRTENATLIMSSNQFSDSWKEA
jgi:endonuclease IV